MTQPLVLVTGATGKVGTRFIAALLADPAKRDWRIRALCHNRVPPAHPRIEVARGSIADRAAVDAAMAGVTHVAHMATCKETPDDVMDVTVKGMFWLLEAARTAPGFRRFLLVGGDAAVGHCFVKHPGPVTEATPWRAYEGCYALSKVLEECMLGQYSLQYGLDGCSLRAPWIMEKDDFACSLTFGEDVFGGPRWCDLVPRDQAKAYAAKRTVPVMLDAAGQSIQRSFVHLDDLVAAMLIALAHPAARGETFNIGMDEPVDYRRVADHLARTLGLPTVDVRTDAHSNWYDISKAKALIGYRPQIDQFTLADLAFAYRRAADDPRKVYYPG